MVGSPLQLRTQRLVLNPLVLSDCDELHAMWTDPGVRRFLWDDKVIPKSQTVDILRQNQQMFADEGLGLWAASLSGVADIVGFGGFWYFHTPPRRELLYGIAPSHWGQGLAIELSQALIDFARRERGLRHIHASTDFANQASVNVLERLGFILERREQADGLDTLFYISFDTSGHQTATI